MFRLLLDVGKEVKIKNPLGIMTVKIEKVLDLTNIGSLYENLGMFEKLRVEFYKEGWFSLCDGNKDILYLIQIGCDDLNRGYKCKIIETEKAYDLERIEKYNY